MTETGTTQPGKPHSGSAASTARGAVQPDRSAAPSSYADRLRTVRVGTRKDLIVTRHLFRGEPSYVIRDPMTLQSHRLDPADYAMFAAIDHSRELGEIFDGLVATDVGGAAPLRPAALLSPDDEEKFYGFVLHLHQLSFLSLPVSDDRLLYQRYVRRKQMRLRQQLTGFLFLRIPLINPDAFLERTLPYARHIFTRRFFALWVCLMGVAGFIVVQSRHELIQPIQGVLLPQNLLMMWITLIGLKVFHEFGHAFACKHFGGYVPEMGAYLIVFTPCAYVDATACWGFTRRRDRLIVCLAGMYVESIFAALAVVVWAMTQPGRTHDLAYNVIFLAGAVTVLFNINPLMRFDGYYALSDLLEIPNLRQRATRHVAAIAKKLFLSVSSPAPSGGIRLRMVLLGFGIASSIYRVAIVLGISALVAFKIPGVGIILAGALLGTTFLGLLVRLTKYLWYSEETAPVRSRALAMSVLLLIALPASVLFVPVPSSVYADGVLERGSERVIHSRVDGFIRSVSVHVGDDVVPGEVLAALENDTFGERIAEVTAAIEASEIRRNVFEVNDPTAAFQEKERLAVLRLELERRRRNLADLTIRFAAAGTVIDCLRATDVGRYLKKGQPVAAVASGSWQVRAILAENEMVAAHPAIGDAVEIRSEAVPGRSLSGRVIRIAPVASRTIATQALTHVGGGSIAVDPQTAQAAQPYFEITVDTGNPANWPSTEAPFPSHGIVCHLRFQTEPETLGINLIRRLIRFTDLVSQQ